jgi:glycogen operon protein
MFLNGQAVFDRSMQSERKGNDSFLLLLNGGSETIRFALPGLPWAASYVPIIDTGDSLAFADTATASALEAGAAIPLKTRSIVVLKTRADR